MTGVTVVRNDFLEEHKAAVDQFMEEHAASAAYANEHVEEAAELVAAAGIIEKAPVAVKAMPKCNITYIDGNDMRYALEGYLSVLCEQMHLRWEEVFREKTFIISMSDKMRSKV